MGLLLAACLWYDTLSDLDYLTSLEAAMVARRLDMIQSEILEEGEIFLTRLETFEMDWQIMIDRMSRMKEGCPHVWEADKLPKYKCCIDNYWEADRYLTKLKELRIYLGPAEQNTLDWYLLDCEWRTEVWRLMYRIQMGNVYNPDGRRLELQRLKEMLKGAWESGQWPDPLPECAYKGPWSIDK